jgi:hypothetical protein
MLATISLQGVFGALQGSAFICFGGGHQHAPQEVVEHCGLACSHHEQWLATAADDAHIDACDCTDFELDLIVLLSTPRTADSDLHLALVTLPISHSTSFAMHFETLFTEHRGPPPDLGKDAGTTRHLAVIRCTRLLV